MTHSLLGPHAVEWQGVQYRTILTSADSGGALSITDCVSPSNSGPPRHIHHDADEAFVLMSGDCEFVIGSRRFTRGPGQTVFVPRGSEHTFRVVSDIPSRHLTILTPGGFEHFFHEMAAGGFRIPQDMPTIAEIAARYHLTFTGPPLMAG